MNSLRKLLITVGAFGLVLLGSSAWSQETTSDREIPAGTEATPSTGPLRKTPSPSYYPLRSSTLVRSGPSAIASIVTTITGQSQPLKALGRVVDPNGDADPLKGGDTILARTWIKVETPSGQTGFVSLADLITPKQLESQKQSNRKILVLESEIAAAKKASGGTIPSGIYSHRSLCEGDGLTGSDLGTYLAAKFLFWQEGAKLHFVQIVAPLEPTIYQQGKDQHPIEMTNFGYIMVQTFQSSKDAALMGYKDKRLWISADGNNFDSYKFCGPEAYDPVMNLLKGYASQRPPEVVSSDQKGVSQ